MYVHLVLAVLHSDDVIIAGDSEVVIAFMSVKSHLSAARLGDYDTQNFYLFIYF